MRVRFFLVVSTTLVAALCSCVTVSKEEFDRVSHGVRATKGDPPAGCAELGSFEANGGWMGFGMAKDILRYKVGQAGGDLVVMDVASSGVTGNAAIITGTGYRCKAAPSKPAGGGAAPSKPAGGGHLVD